MDNGTFAIKTIGVYGSTEESFFNALTAAGVDAFCDIRQRRGVRGSKYAYVNATRLQQKLKSLGIKYVHIKELAPSTELRERQKKHDLNAGTTKTTRESLGAVFVEGYKQQNLGYFTVEKFKKELPQGVKTICLFCVEREPKACHRSLVAKFLSDKMGSPVEDLLP